MEKKIEQRKSSESCILAFDYINYYFQKCGYNWVDCPLNGRDTEQFMVKRWFIRYYAGKFAQKNHKDLDLMCTDVDIVDPLYPTYSKIAKELFVGGISWQKIIILFSWTGVLALKSFKSKNPYSAVDIASFLDVFLDGNLMSWIVSSSC